MRAFKSDILDIRVVVHRQTEAAVLVSEDGDVEKAVWLPLSQIEIDDAPSKGRTRYADVQIPEWLAAQRGLV